MMSTAIRQTDHFYLKQEEPYKSCFLALRSLILQADPNLSETTKYGMPCFCYHKKIAFYLWKDKKTNEPYILFADGNLLDHPALEQGKRARMKTFRVNPRQDLPINTIEETLLLALTRYRNPS